MANEHSEDAPGHNKPVTIVVNLNGFEVTGKEISYREVAKLAYPSDIDSAEIIYTISYTNPKGPDGELHEGQSVKLHEGMVFVVGKSNRS
jgi:hypothetical protein